MVAKQGRRRWWVWLIVAIVVALLAVAAIIALPIMLHQSAGLSGQEDPGDTWPTTVTARGDDGRERTLSVASPDGGEVDTAAVEVGERVVVTGTGYDPSRGIYVAVCVVPEDPSLKPGPCIGGSPQESQDPEANEGAIQYGESNWINNDWAWRLFGARSFDAPGEFTAYLEMGEPVGEGFDCRVDRCGIYTRNDHTASGDRVQDVYIPIRYAD